MLPGSPACAASLLPSMSAAPPRPAAASGMCRTSETRSRKAGTTQGHGRNPNSRLAGRPNRQPDAGRSLPRAVLVVARIRCPRRDGWTRCFHQVLRLPIQRFAPHCPRTEAQRPPAVP
jgi:hypothetical protein